MQNDEYIQEIKDRLAERYTAAEIADALEILVEDLIEEYFYRIPKWMLEEVGVAVLEEET